MIPANGAREAEILRRVLASEDPSAYLDAVLIVDGVDYTDVLGEWDVGRPSDAEAGVVLNATVDATVGLSAKGKAAGLSFEVADPEGRLGSFRMPRFRGRVLRSTPAAPGQTTLLCVTAGYHNGSVQLGRALAFTAEEPSEVYYQAIVLNEHYDRSIIEVERVEAPPITRQDDTEFSRIDKVADVLGAVLEAVDCFAFDTVLGGHRMRRDVGPALGRTSSHAFFVGPDIDPDDWRPERAEEDYSGVMAYREAQDLVTKRGRDVEVVARVIFRQDAVPRGVFFEIPMDEGTTDDEAWDTVYEVAARIEPGLYELTVNLKWIHPALEDGDFVTVTESGEDEDGVYVRTWLCEARVTRPKDDMTEDLTLRMVVGDTQRIPTAAVDDVPILEPGPARPAIGRDYQGVPYVSLDVPWMRRVSAGEVEVNVTMARAMGVNIEDELGPTVRLEIP